MCLSFFRTSLSLAFNRVPAVFFTARLPASSFREDACGKLLWQLFQNTNIYSLRYYAFAFTNTLPSLPDNVGLYPGKDLSLYKLGAVTIPFYICCAQMSRQGDENQFQEQGDTGAKQLMGNAQEKG